MVQAAIAREMRVYALTEHMPRGPEDLYPEEASTLPTSPSSSSVFSSVSSVSSVSSLQSRSFAIHVSVIEVEKAG